MYLSLASLHLSNVFLISPSTHPHQKTMANPTQTQLQERKAKNKIKKKKKKKVVEAVNQKRAKSWRSVGSTVLSIGKKAAIAGAAVTSAPVVVPPALLFSAIGLAFAVPFGVACTDRVMRSLLSQPAVGPQAEEQEEEVDVQFL